VKRTIEQIRRLIRDRYWGKKDDETLGIYLKAEDWRTLSQRLDDTDFKDPQPQEGAAARADVIAVVMLASEHDSNPYRFWVDVTKNRFGTPQRAAFPTLEGAFDFIKRLGRHA
jgi:hypothetical protein